MHTVALGIPICSAHHEISCCLVARQPRIHQMDRLVEGSVPIAHDDAVRFCPIAVTRPTHSPEELVRERTTVSRRVVIADDPTSRTIIAVLEDLGERLRRGRNLIRSMVTR